MEKVSVRDSIFPASHWLTTLGALCTGDETTARWLSDIKARGFHRFSWKCSPQWTEWSGLQLSFTSLWSGNTKVSVRLFQNIKKTIHIILNPLGFCGCMCAMWCVCWRLNPGILYHWATSAAPFYFLGQGLSRWGWLTTCDPSTSTSPCSWDSRHVHWAWQILVLKQLIYSVFTDCMKSIWCNVEIKRTLVKEFISNMK